MTNARALPDAAACPRCGYDLTGITSSWQDACGLDGICAECGLAFAWGDVLSPVRMTPRWLVEHSYRPWWGTLAPTMWRALRPWSFWRRLRMGIPFRYGRLALVAACAGLLCHVIIAAAVFAQVTTQLSNYARTAGGASLDDPFDACMRCAAWPYSNHWIPMSVSLIRSFPATGKNVTFTSPANFRTESLADVWLAMAIATDVLAPFCYLVLRQTLRKTRVRPAHLVRIWAYSLCIMPALVVVHHLFQAAQCSWLYNGFRFSGPFRLVVRLLQSVHDVVPLPIVFFGIAVAAYFAAWYWATARYLRLPHAAGVALAMVTMAALVAMILGVVLAPHSVVR